MPDRGQASVELVALVALVAAVLVLGRAAASASGIGERVTAQMARGLCVVTGGGDCDADRLPCALRWRRDQRALELSVVVARLGGGLLVVREDRSDGTVAMTLAAEAAGGVEGALAAEVGLLDVEARAAVLAAQGHGRRWVLPDHASAARFGVALRSWASGRRGALPDLPPADEVFHERTAARLRASARLTARGLGGELAVSGEAVVGLREARATGHRTVYLRLRDEASARGRLSRPRGSVVAGMRRVGAREVAVTFDRDGRALVLVDTQRGGAAPPEAAGLLPAGEGLVLVVERRLDLADAAGLEAAREALRGRTGALQARLREDAVVHVRAYAVHSSHRGGGVALGGLGVHVDHERERARLVTALTRDLAGGWARRADCA